MSYKDVEASKFKFNMPDRSNPVRGGNTKMIDNAFNAKQEKPVEFHYKELGKLTEDTNGSYAKKCNYINGRTEYFVKVATAGAGIGKLLNPWGVYYKPGDDTRYEKQMGRKTYEFKHVNQNIFDQYMKFLETKNQRYLLNAERENSNA